MEEYANSKSPLNRYQDRRRQRYIRNFPLKSIRMASFDFRNYLAAPPQPLGTFSTFTQ
uniref:Uncharacterized protein n=1 Tax=Daucus carota subsp. sativus TaxID=79200 RepID=A0A175YQP8_DAUCS